jgi:hypothetical protein
MTSSDNGDLSIKKPLQSVTDESSLALIIQPRQMARVKWRCALQPSDITVQFQLKLEFLGAKTARQVEHISVAAKPIKFLARWERNCSHKRYFLVGFTGWNADSVKTLVVPRFANATRRRGNQLEINLRQ